MCLCGLQWILWMEEDGVFSFQFLNTHYYSFSNKHPLLQFFYFSFKHPLLQFLNALYESKIEMNNSPGNKKFKLWCKLWETELFSQDVKNKLNFFEWLIPLGHDESRHEIKMYSIDLIVNDSVFESHAYISMSNQQTIHRTKSPP